MNERSDFVVPDITTRKNLGLTHDAVTTPCRSRRSAIPRPTTPPGPRYISAKCDAAGPRL
jgi:hypothetical protein